MSPTTSVSEKLSIEGLYAISRSVALASEWKPALDEIANLVRSFFIFDNLVVYIYDKVGNSQDVMYARAVGRGRSAEADGSWGEALANQLIQSRTPTMVEPEVLEGHSRLEMPFILGIPLAPNDQYLGSIIFIRFGGPIFTSRDQALAEFIAQQISLLVERQKLQEEHRQLEAQHQQALLQDNFISTISHELRSPLGFIKGYATTLLRSDTTWDTATQLDFLRIIDAETDRLQELIDNLLDSSRLQSGQLKMMFQPVRLDALVNDVVTRSHLHRPAIQINTHIDPLVGTISGDPRRLVQVLENLLSNAVKYAPGSEIDVKTVREANTIHISVQDHGPGISEPYQVMVFDRFFRTPDSANAHGSGLGLFICKQIIQAHSGKISVESHPGEGAIFHIYLPDA